MSKISIPVHLAISLVLFRRSWVEWAGQYWSATLQPLLETCGRPKLCTHSTDLDSRVIFSPLIGILSWLSADTTLLDFLASLAPTPVSHFHMFTLFVYIFSKRYVQELSDLNFWSYILMVMVVVVQTIYLFTDFYR